MISAVDAHMILTASQLWAWLKTAELQSLVGPAIALMALLFTVGSFWWLQARQGKLRSWQPFSWAFGRSPSQVVLRFPLVLYNTGAKPIIVVDLRLSFPTVPGQPSLPWRSTRSKLRPDIDDDLRLPAAFSIPGRQAQQYFIEFGLDSKDPLPGINLKTGQYDVLIEVLLGHKRKWQQLVTFPLEGKHIDTGAYLAYSNTALRPIS
jgi:hypothetical protein